MLNQMERRRALVALEKREFRAKRISKFQYKQRVLDWMKMQNEKVNRWYLQFFKP
jgi:hypothetical protein